MTRTTVSLQGDCGLTGGELTGQVDVTAAFQHADDLAAGYGVDTVILPSNSKLQISRAQSPHGATLIEPAHAKHWVVDNQNVPSCELVVAPGNWTDEITVWQHTNHDGALLAFSINGQAARQMGGHPDHAPNGDLQGWTAHGLRVQGCKDPQIHSTIRNLRSISATGIGSAFDILLFGGTEGGQYWVAFDTDDGSIGTETIAFQNPNQTSVDPWIVRSLRANRMWRGLDVYQGYDGIVYDAIVTNCSGPADAKAPNGKISGNAFNIEAGPAGTGHVTLVAPKTSGCDRFLAVVGNYNNRVSRVSVQGGTSTGDGTGILISGDAPGLVDVADWLCDSPRDLVLDASGMESKLQFTNSHYRIPAGSSAKLGTGPRPGLTVVGAAGPTISAVAPPQLTRGVTRQLALAGSGFAAGCTVKCSGAGVTLVNVARRSATQITCTAKVGRAAARTARTLTVTNRDGHSGTARLTIA